MIVGPEEWEREAAAVRDMRRRDQDEVSLSRLRRGAARGAPVSAALSWAASERLPRHLVRRGAARTASASRCGWRAGCTAAATTAAWCSWTCATAPGIVQVVFNPETAPEAHARSHELRSEWVISVRGEVVRRSEETVNRDMPTGEVEVRATRRRGARARPRRPPFPLDEETAVDEALRLRYRYLDLRREPMQRALELRHRRHAGDPRLT